MRLVRTVHAVRTFGAQAAIEFVYMNGGPDAEIVVDIQRLCLDEILLVYGGGRYGNVLTLLPPLIIDKRTLEEGIGKVGLIIERHVAT